MGAGSANGRGVRGNVTLTAANTYTGTTTVTAGTLAVNRPTAGSAPLGSGTVTLGGGTLSFRGAASPLTVTGFQVSKRGIDRP